MIFLSEEDTLKEENEKVKKRKRVKMSENEWKKSEIWVFNENKKKHSQCKTKISKYNKHTSEWYYYIKEIVFKNK